MAIDSQSVWDAEWLNLPVSDDINAGSLNISQYVGDRLSGKMAFAAPVVGAFSFTFNVAAMAAVLQTATPNIAILVGATKFADAWKAGILGATVSAASGTYNGAPTPSTTFASPPVVTPGPAIATAYATLIADIIALTPEVTLSKMPIQLRKASASVNWILTGVNVVPGDPLVVTAGVV